MQRLTRLITSLALFSLTGCGTDLFAKIAGKSLSSLIALQDAAPGQPLQSADTGPDCGYVQAAIHFTATQTGTEPLLWEGAVQVAGGKVWLGSAQDLEAGDIVPDMSWYAKDPDRSWQVGWKLATPDPGDKDVLIFKIRPGGPLPGSPDRQTAVNFYTKTNKQSKSYKYSDLQAGIHYLNLPMAKARGF